MARFYSRPPAEFLAMPTSEVERHMEWTDRLLAAAEVTRLR
jgi:hypothetical protein